VFAQFVSARDHHTIDDVKMFFVLGWEYLPERSRRRLCRAAGTAHDFTAD
jgi:hypothetical protein